MVISTTSIQLYMQKYLPFIMYYGSALLLFTHKLHFDRSLHIESSDPTYVQNFRPVTLTFFEILGFKLKNKDGKIIFYSCGCMLLFTNM